MERHHVHDRADERAERAALRENVLRTARLLGWSTRTAIAFAERAARRPWKRCRSDQLAAVVADLHTIQQGLALSRRLVFLGDQAENGADRRVTRGIDDPRS